MSGTEQDPTNTTAEGLNVAVPSDVKNTKLDTNKTTDTTSINPTTDTEGFIVPVPPDNKQDANKTSEPVAASTDADGKPGDAENPNTDDTKNPNTDDTKNPNTDDTENPNTDDATTTGSSGGKKSRKSKRKSAKKPKRKSTKKASKRKSSKKPKRKGGRKSSRKCKR